MNRITLIITAALACMAAGCPRSKPQGGRPSGDTVGQVQHFTVAVEQGGRTIPVVGHEVHLRKAPFTIVIAFSKLKGATVMVNASRSGALADAVKAGRPAGSVVPLPSQPIQESLGNPYSRIFITNKSYNYWYYISNEIHRFDMVERRGYGYVCRRRVANFSDGVSAPSVPIAELDGRVLYLVFVKEHLDRAMGGRIEEYTEYLKLVFD